MQNSTTGFNSSTIPWTTPDMGEFNGHALPEYIANPMDIESFQQNGVVILREVFADWVESLRAGFDRNLQNPHAYRYPCESLPEGSPGRFFDSYCNWDIIPEYRDFVFNSRAAALAGRFMQSTTAQLFHEHNAPHPGTRICPTIVLMEIRQQAFTSLSIMPTKTSPFGLSKAPISPAHSTIRVCFWMTPALTMMI